MQRCIILLIACFFPDVGCLVEQAVQAIKKGKAFFISGDTVIFVFNRDDTEWILGEDKSKR